MSKKLTLLLILFGCGFEDLGGGSCGQDPAEPIRVFIMTDMEGVCGVLDLENWCLPNSRYFEQAKELLTREVNAAIEGFLEAGVTEILVADGHGAGAVNPGLLHPRAELSRNWPPGRPYPFALNSRKFDFVAWVGQHPKAGTVRGHLCHTGSMNVRETRINGLSVGEFGEMVLCASELGVPVIFATGCEAFCQEAKALIPDVETVAVKRGLQEKPGHHLPAEAYAKHNLSAIHLAPEKARGLIREGARKALLRARGEKPGPLAMKPPYEAVIILRADGVNPARIGRKRHDKSVIDLLNAPWSFEPIMDDPAQAISR